MVKLEEVIDEEFLRTQEGPIDDDDWDTDTDSETSSIASITPDETLYERILALQDIIPAPYRRSINSKFSTASSWVKSGIVMGGKTLWVVSTSALLLGVPWALAYSEEQQMAEMDREMQMQQRTNEFLTPGAQPGAQVNPAL
ncbi:mitochondrial import translocase, subunit Tom22 [Lindgomyces ingoldianus]|uniref:Mitochondrial import translocase, subunit Tom22 n=1 Tax=Lindgomyces ingoldianus TaxID=673940 RepID=A0ACB6R723_9PLEO|nr:mitochondrial import translocase, subunit Tom22 [Lindgomyces ingoldianus]KAF2475099.1 mitochondrial import translocase, subunit Tom22 [Lindgomyces ingoldianus]